MIAKMAVLISLFFLSSMVNAELPKASQPAHTEAPRMVNIINFIRGVEPRLKVDLVEPVREQFKLLKANNLPGTFLIQYDAMQQKEFVELLKRELTERDELGIWLEIVQPLVEKAGITWRGRFPWDWHTDVGFSVGYTPAEREKLIDVFMADFQATFGRRPRSVGSWLIDAHTLGYLADKYDVVASCNCKEQVGTDGYTLWGGYWNQAYYPSRLNAIMPAQTAEGQIPIPVFRMLGSDPIYQYDLDLGQPVQGVVSLEPVYEGGGGHPPWVRWFFDVNFNTPCLALAYAQVGQENSFGWGRMAVGLKDQISLLAQMVREGKVRVETLEASGRWFRQNFPVTPATAVTALSDWKNEVRKSVWYESRFYRTNLFWQGEEFRIRDIHLFNQQYAERYLKTVCTSSSAVYDTLAVMDGFLWSEAAAPAGISLVKLDSGQAVPLSVGEPTVTEQGREQLLVRMPVQGGGEFNLLLSPRQIECQMIGDDAPAAWALRMHWSRPEKLPKMQVGDRGIQYTNNGFSYTLELKEGTPVADGSQAVLLKAGREKLILMTDGIR